MFNNILPFSFLFFLSFVTSVLTFQLLYLAMFQKYLQKTNSHLFNNNTAVSSLTILLVIFLVHKNDTRSHLGFLFLLSSFNFPST